MIRLEQLHKLRRTEFIALDLITAESSARDLPFILLQLEDSLLDGVLDRQLGDVDVTLLPQSVGSVEGLFLVT